MKNVNLIAMLFVFLFVALVGLVPAQTAAAPTACFPAVDVGKAAGIDQLLSSLTGTIDNLNAEIGTFKVHTQSDRVHLYDLQRQLSLAKSEYNVLLASITTDVEASATYRQTAWHDKRQANQFAAKMYSALPANAPAPTPIGRLTALFN
jgi:hypothetical protein